MGIFNMMELTNDKAAAPEENKTPVSDKSEAVKVDDDTTVIKNQDKVIELKGSLSEVYTKALNAEYALENIQNIVNTIVSENEEKTDGKVEPVYVDVINKDDIENQDVLTLSIT